MFTARRLGGISAMSCPSIMMWPSVGTSRPASMRSNVVLPHPEGPSRAKNSPGRMSRLTLSTPTVVPHRFEILRKLIMGLALASVAAALMPLASAWSTALILSLFLRSALRHHHHDHEQDGEQDQHGRFGFDLSVHREAQHRIDLDREGDGVRPRGEKR